MTTPLSGTGTPAPGALPTDTGGSNLLAFKDALSQVGQLARGERAKLMGGFMAPFSGTVKASDFNQLSQSLNSSSDTTLQDYVKNRIAPEYKKPDLHYATNDAGDVTALDPATGAVVWTAKGVGNRQTSGGGTLAERTAQALADYSDSFTADNYLSNGIPTIDSEGFITPEAWKAAIAEAPSRGITRADFIKQFGYQITTQGQVSPKYGLTPVEIKLLLGSASGTANPFAQ